MGLAGEQQYLNMEGKQVRVTFRGLRDLDVVHDDLEDGAELFYEETVGVLEDDLRRWVTSKEALSTFAPPRRGGRAELYARRGHAHVGDEGSIPRRAARSRRARWKWCYELVATQEFRSTREAAEAFAIKFFGRDIDGIPLDWST